MRSSAAGGRRCCRRRPRARCGRATTSRRRPSAASAARGATATGRTAAGAVRGDRRRGDRGAARDDAQQLHSGRQAARDGHHCGRPPQGRPSKSRGEVVVAMSGPSAPRDRERRTSPPAQPTRPPRRRQQRRRRAARRLGLRARQPPGVVVPRASRLGGRLAPPLGEVWDAWGAAATRSSWWSTASASRSGRRNRGSCRCRPRGERRADARHRRQGRLPGGPQIARRTAARHVGNGLRVDNSATLRALAAVTPRSVPALRTFANEVVLDVLFYEQPAHRDSSGAQWRRRSPRSSRPGTTTTRRGRRRSGRWCSAATLGAVICSTCCCRRRRRPRRRCRARPATDAQVVVGAHARLERVVAGSHRHAAALCRRRARRRRRRRRRRAAGDLEPGVLPPGAFSALSPSARPSACSRAARPPPRPRLRAARLPGLLQRVPPQRPRRLSPRAAVGKPGVCRRRRRVGAAARVRALAGDKSGLQTHVKLRNTLRDVKKMSTTIMSWASAGIDGAAAAVSAVAMKQRAARRRLPCSRSRAVDAAGGGGGGGGARGRGRVVGVPRRAQRRREGGLGAAGDGDRGGQRRRRRRVSRRCRRTPRTSSRETWRRSS